ncbi:MAG: pyruvate, phosphate dikinase [Desulfobacterium sp.]|nr:pyruvate, phosphate dikinase [Desulfobacterium sp.]
MNKILDFFKKQNTCTLLTPLEGEHSEKYLHFRTLLDNNHIALHRIADMESYCYGSKPFTLHQVEKNCHELTEAVSTIVSSLEALSGKDYTPLRLSMDRIGKAVDEELNPRMSFTDNDLVIPFENIRDTEFRRMVGAKAGNLALIQNILKLPVPYGFAATAYAYHRFMVENNLEESIAHALATIAEDTGKETEIVSEKLREMIMAAKVPVDMEEALMNAYTSLERKTRKGVHIAVRSSAIGEDTEASFAGQYATVLNVTKENIVHAYKTVIASKYSARAISYRLHYGLDDRETPMCVAGIVMIDSRSSGVLYTENPSQPSSGIMKINAIPGLGEHLVDGSASPDVFLIDKNENKIVEKQIVTKDFKLINLSTGGTALEKVAESEQKNPAIEDTVVFQLRDFGLILEGFFKGPQDIEWATDKNGKLFILQSRPLHISEDKSVDQEIQIDEKAHPVLLSGGKAASPGIAAGRVVKAAVNMSFQNIPSDAILVVKTASPDYAGVINRIRGIITDMGSVTSHLSSVAREFGVPALVDTKNATSLLTDGETITLYVETGKVYQGSVESLVKAVKPVKKPILESQVYHKTQRILNLIAPLHLTDPQAPNFNPQGCESYHDIIRFTHEKAMQHMFALGQISKKGITSVKLVVNLPLQLYLIDLGDGLRFGLTTCDKVTPGSVESVPFKAIWKGFTHPGITWSGAINFNMGNFMSLMASGATVNEANMPGGPSYIILSQDYINMSVRFGYHFATIDALCTEDSNQNYIALRFSGGVGPIYGRSLRISFLANVLSRLDFDVSVNGDLLDAVLARYDKPGTEERLDKMARLLACSRLLDMVITNQQDVVRFTEAFFREEYNFLEKKQENEPKELYVHTGFWRSITEEKRKYCIQDGSKWSNKITSGFTKVMNKAFGTSYQEFLDNIEAYYYFPIAIAKNSELSEGSASVRIRPVSGYIDRAGGLAFGIKDVCNYFVFRINALEDNVILFEFENAKRVQRKAAKMKIDPGEWYGVRIETEGDLFKGFVNDELIMEYQSQQSFAGYVGLWTKADSVTQFDDFRITTGSSERIIEF